MFLKILQNSQENTCARVSFLIKLQSSVCNFVKKDILAQVLPCEFCEISNNTFSTEHLRATASVMLSEFKQIDLTFPPEIIRGFRRIEVN